MIAMEVGLPQLDQARLRRGIFDYGLEIRSVGLIRLAETKLINPTTPNGTEAAVRKGSSKTPG
jgi:hypothetical protein